MANFFYEGNGLLESTIVERLKRAFNMLADLFFQVGLRTKLVKRYLWYVIHDNKWEDTQLRLTRDR